MKENKIKAPVTSISTDIKVEVIRSGKVLTTLPNQKNIVLGTYLGSPSGSFNIGSYCQVGTGNSVPDISDTTLESYLASSGAVGWPASQNTLNGNVFDRKATTVFTFTLGSVVGNISELGISSGATSGLNTRALIKDTGGNPTTITVTAQDQLIITYTIHKAIKMTATSGSVDLDGTAINYTIRPVIEVSGVNSNYVNQLDIVNRSFRPFFFGVHAHSVDPVTYNLNILDGAYAPQQGGDSVISRILNGTTAEVTHACSLSISQGNVPENEYRQIVMNYPTNWGENWAFFMIEFTGPDYISKTEDDIMTIEFLETLVQV